MLKVLLGSALGASVSWRLRPVTDQGLDLISRTDKYRTHKHIGKYNPIVPSLYDHIGLNRKTKFKEQWPKIFGCEAKNLLGSTETL